MSNKGEKSMDKRLSVAICTAFEQLIQNIKNEPSLILEAESQSVDGDKTLQEIGFWLFGRRKTDDHRNSSGYK